MITKCPRCGLPVDANSEFCGNCGYTLRSAGTVTSSPAQPTYPSGGAPSGATLPPYPGSAPSSPAYPLSNVPSSPSYSGNNAPVQPPYTGTGSGSPPSPFYTAGTMPPSPTPANGAPLPPPPYPGNGHPSAPGYSPSGMQYPQPQYGVDPSKTPPQPQPPRRGGNKVGLFAIIGVIVVIIIVGVIGLNAFHLLPGTANKPSTSGNQGTSSTQNSPNASATATALAMANAGITPTTGTTPSTGATSTPAGSTPTSVTPTATTAVINSYSAAQPGPGCDNNGGAWTPANIGGISCGTTITINSGESRGYLYFQLPSGQQFSSDNSVGVTDSVDSNGDNTPYYNCVGLAEQNANSGFLAEFCHAGQWSMYSISGAGAVVKTLAQNVTSTRQSTNLLLSIKGNTLTFTIDAETHSLTIVPFQPTKVAITYLSGYYDNENIQVSNFSYTPL